MKTRVVVTGLGVVSPLGNSVEEFWSSLLAGKSGVGPITRFDTTIYPARIAAEVKNFDLSGILDKKKLRRMDPSEQYAVGASEEAVKDSGLDLEAVDLDRCGVIIGSGIGGITTFEKQHSQLEKSGPGRVSPFFIPMMIIDMCAGLVSIRYGFRGPNYATVSACASSAHAILDAMHIIKRGDADIMLAGGAEASITPTAVAGFCQAKAISTRNDEPEKASRPFDVGRDGFVMGEGSAMLLLESLEHAQARGAEIYGEVVGAGMTADAYHMTAPAPDGHGAKRAMVLAIKDAGLEPNQIDYINTHGTATPLGDIAETTAIKDVLGEHAAKIPCNSTKSMIGHLLGSAGAIEAVVSLLSIKNSIVHKTTNIDDPDPECDLDYVAEGNRQVDVRYALSNSFGFGGHNVSLVVGKFDGAS
ncbi:MAG: beta-ketoacyl-ACP synthase II [candidate division Zixibacteria bacterium]|nr:beta-ketoacyl-ACP synthase II [candidate division Zixibacteria bacterium]